MLTAPQGRLKSVKSVEIGCVGGDAGVEMRGVDEERYVRNGLRLRREDVRARLIGGETGELGQVSAIARFHCNTEQKSVVGREFDAQRRGR